MEGGEGDDEDESLLIEDVDPIYGKREENVAGLEWVEGGRL